MGVENNNFLSPPDEATAFGKIIERLVLCFFAAMTCTIIFLFFKDRMFGWQPIGYATAGIYIFGMIFCCGMIARMMKKVNLKYLLLAVMTISLAVRIGYVLVIPTQPVSDFSLLYNAAEASAAGDFSWSHASDGYFYRWSYQIPFVLYEAVVIRIFHSVFAIKLLNVLFMVGANYLVYRIARGMVSQTAALCAALIYSLFPGAIMYASVLTNQHISLFFLLLGVALMLQGKRWWVFLLAGLSLAISNLMRPEAIVVLAAMGCCGLLRWMQRPDMNTFKQVVLAILLVFAAYWLMQKAVELILTLLDIAPNGIGNRAPEWKFVLGLGDLESYGGYSEKNVAILSISDPSARKAATINLIREELQQSDALRSFFVQKISRFWTLPQSTYWSFWNLEDSMTLLPGVTAEEYKAYLQWFERGALLLVYLMALPTPALLWKRKNVGAAALLSMSILCVIFCVYLLIEIQPRYRCFAIPFWLVLDGITLQWLIDLKKRKM